MCRYVVTVAHPLNCYSGGRTLRLVLACIEELVGMSMVQTSNHCLQDSAFSHWSEQIVLYGAPFPVRIGFCLSFVSACGAVMRRNLNAASHTRRLNQYSQQISCQNRVFLCLQCNRWPQRLVCPNVQEFLLQLIPPFRPQPKAIPLLSFTRLWALSFSTFHMLHPPCLCRYWRSHHEAFC